MNGCLFSLLVYYNYQNLIGDKQLYSMKNWSNIIYFQRGNKTKDRSYTIVVTTPQCLEFLHKYGGQLVGTDTKGDLTMYKFPVLLLTYCDPHNHGRPGGVAICNCETQEFFETVLSVVAMNVPQGTKDEGICQTCYMQQTKNGSWIDGHIVNLHQFNDREGWYLTRACADPNSYKPSVMHDKSGAIFNAVHARDQNSLLCNFHSIAAVKKWLIEDSTVRLFVRPLLTGFKVVMQSCHAIFKCPRV